MKGNNLTIPIARGLPIDSEVIGLSGRVWPCLAVGDIGDVGGMVGEGKEANEL